MEINYRVFKEILTTTTAYLGSSFMVKCNSSSNEWRQLSLSMKIISWIFIYMDKIALKCVY